MLQPTKLFLILLLLTTTLFAQQKDTSTTVGSQIKMTFPSIYFKNKSTDYAAMPYTVDSCFNYITKHVKDIKAYVIWRDSSETEVLTNKRIKKLKTDLNKYTPSREIYIQSMGKEQKISQHTIAKGDVQFLRALNTAFDISETTIPIKKKWKKNHGVHPRIWCLSCWKRGAFFKKRASSK